MYSYWLPKVVFQTPCLNIISHYLSPAYSRFFLTSMSSGSQILILLSNHWRLNCSTFALQSSSELWTKVSLFKTLPISSDLSCDLLRPFLKARYIWTITMDTTKWKLQIYYNNFKEITSAVSGLVYVCFCSFVKCSRVWAIAGKNSNKPMIFLINFNYFICIYIFI